MVIGFVFAASGSENSQSSLNDVGASLILAVWLGGFAHAVVIWALHLDGVADPIAAAERERNDRRVYGRRLLAKQPAFAREFRVWGVRTSSTRIIAFLSISIMFLNNFLESCVGSVPNSHIESFSIDKKWDSSRRSMISM